MAEKYYLLTMYGDLEPGLSEPLPTEDEVLTMAKEHRMEDPGREDGLFMVKIAADGTLSIDAFSGDDLDDEEGEEGEENG